VRASVSVANSPLLSAIFTFDRRCKQRKKSDQLRRKKQNAMFQCPWLATLQRRSTAVAKKEAAVLVAAVP